MAYTATDRIRSGKGGKAYRRERRNLRARAQRENLPCAHCGRPFDWSLTDSNDRGYFTADHPQNISQGGSISGQDLAPYHRGCNSSKGNKIAAPRTVETYL